MTSDGASRIVLEDANGAFSRDAPLIAVSRGGEVYGFVRTVVARDHIANCRALWEGEYGPRVSNI